MPDTSGGGGHRHQLLRRTDDYFKTNLTDDKFLSENVNIASNLGGDRWDQQQQQQLRSKLRRTNHATGNPREFIDDGDCDDDDRMVHRFHRAAPSIVVQTHVPLHKSIDTFLDAEREASAGSKR